MLKFLRFRKYHPVLYFSLIAVILTILLFYYMKFSLTAFYLSVNAITFLFYGYDKFISKSPDAWRVPEAVLHILSLAGGFVGAFAGRQFFRHKTQKNIFLVIIILSLTVHAGIYFYLL